LGIYIIFRVITGSCKFEKRVSVKIAIQGKKNDAAGRIILKWILEK
jgi:hypothetical protein